MSRILPIAAALLLIGACASSDTTATSVPAATTTTSGPAAPTTTAPPVPATTAPTSTTAATTTTTVPPLPVGDYEFSFVTLVTTRPDGTAIVTADFAQFLTGEEANEAARKAGVIGAGESVPNDYFIVNENPRLREIPIAADAVVRLQVCFAAGPCVTEAAVSVEQWAELVAGNEPEGLPSGFQWYGGGTLPYWLTIEGGTIVEVQEQYLP